jgi:hypothetical protein
VHALKGEIILSNVPIRITCWRTEKIENWKQLYARTNIRTFARKDAYAKSRAQLKAQQAEQRALREKAASAVTAADMQRRAEYMRKQVEVF